MVVNYEELEEILRNELNKISNLAAFCKQNNITDSQYIRLSEIRNKRNLALKKKYTLLVIRILGLLGYEVYKHDYFRIKHKSHGSKHRDTKPPDIG